jgi:hypothetical protein
MLGNPLARCTSRLRLFHFSKDPKKMEVPISVKRDDEQHSMWYSQALPYAELLSDETETWLHDIVDYFVLSVKIRDFSPGALAAIKQLTRYERT